MHADLGDAYCLSGDSENAAGYYQKVTEIDPHNKIAYLELGNAYYCMGMYEKAVDSFQKVRELDPNCEKTSYYLARTYLKQGNLGKADQAAQEALHIIPTNQTTLELLKAIEQVALDSTTDMTMIPKGKFQMGSKDDEAKTPEKLRHTVYIDAFYMDIYPVTNAQYKNLLKQILSGKRQTFNEHCMIAIT